MNKKRAYLLGAVYLMAGVLWADGSPVTAVSKLGYQLPPSDGGGVTGAPVSAAKGLMYQKPPTNSGGITGAPVTAAKGLRATNPNTGKGGVTGAPVTTAKGFMFQQKGSKGNGKQSFQKGGANVMLNPQPLPPGNKPSTGGHQ